MWFMYFDPLYLLIMAVSILLSGACAVMVKARFAAGRAVPLASGQCGAEVAARILYQAGIDDVQVVEHRGFLSDHYNPMTKTLALSPEVFRGRHAAAAGVAAHEVGHAIQHASGYALLGLRTALVPLASLGSNLGLWLVIFGIMLGSADQVAQGDHGLAYYLAIGGVGLFGLATVFAFITVPIEFDASARAKRQLADLGIIRSGEETAHVRAVLNAAGLTYVAAAVIALMQLLYWAMRAGLIGNRR